MASTALSQSLSSTLSAQCVISHKSSIGSTPSLSLNRSLPLKLHPVSIRSNTNRISFISKCAPTDNESAATKSETPIELRYPSFPTVVDINQIMDILPHRYPFLLVDRVIEYNPGVSAVAIKNVTINDQFFNGHFPGRPIMPGVLMIEAMAQVGGVVMLQPEVGGSRSNFFFAGIDKVRFRKPVVAGDTLVMRMTLTKLQKRFGIAKMEGKAYVGGDVVCEGEFLMATGGSE